MAIYGYTKNYKLIKPQFNTDTWHDYIYDNLDTIDAIMSAIYASGNWKGFWATNTTYTVGDVIIDQDTDTMYKVMVDHTTSEATFAEEFAAHPTYYELWSPNNLAEDWAIKMDGVVSNVDYSSKAYAISSDLIDNGSAQEWAIKSGTIGTTGEYSAKKHSTDAASSASTAASEASNAANSATLSQKWAVDANLVASTDYSSKSWATGSLDAGSAKDWAIKEGGQVGTTGKYSAKVYSLAAENHYEKARDWASKTNGQVESTDYSAKAYAISEGLISAGSAKEWSNKAKAWATSSTIIEDGKYGASYYALQAYNANVSAQNNKTLSKDWATKMDGQVASTDYSSKYYAGQSAASANNSQIWAEGTDEQVQALGGTHSSKVWAEQSTNANIDLDNLSATGEAHFANPALTNSPYTTNRILEIPQDIKLELSSGTLTLKSGSKVYLPNGFELDGITPKFDVVIVQNDCIETQSFNAGSNKLEHFYDNSTGTFGDPFIIGFNLFSGGSAPTSFQTGTNLWWDTSANKMKYTTDTGSTWNVVQYSLPLCVFSSPTSITSIDQIFNGFGYICSTVFALPGVKVQIPNGRNEDGTCKSIEYRTEVVKAEDMSAWGGDFYGKLIVGDQFIIQPDVRFHTKTDGVLWIFKDNQWYIDANGTVTKRYIVFVGNIHMSSGKVSSLNLYDVDSVANSNASNFSQAGRSYLSGLGMPSSRYIDLTLGATGSSYTAPANGYFKFVGINAQSSTHRLIMNNTTGSLYANQSSPIDVGAYGGIFVPALKGDSVVVEYTGYTSYEFQFVYAEGEN